MSTPGRPTQDLGWLITNFVERVPDVAHAVVVSSDGLPLAFSAGFPQERADPASPFSRRRPVILGSWPMR